MKRLVLGILVLLSIAASASAAPIVYNANADFSNSQTGAWSYGYSSGLPINFTAFGSYGTSIWGASGLEGWYATGLTTRYELPGIFKNTTAGDLEYANTVRQPNTLLSLHPSVSDAGVAEYAIVRFTAPTTSSYDVTALFQGLDFVGPAQYGSTTDVHIFLLVNSQLAGTINSYGPAGKVSYAERLFMNSGDTLDFAVGPNSTTSNGFYWDSTGFDATVSAVPEPASITLLGLGLAGIARAMRRRR